MILRTKIKKSLVLNNKWLDYKELFKKTFFRPTIFNSFTIYNI
jgi:hypothetical protein